MNNRELDPSAEVVHLRRLLDIQPGCLMRLDADGTVLAANDSALTLLGAKSTEALGRDFALWVPPDQRDRWRAFTLGVVQGRPASIECDIVALSGDRRPAFFRGVPLTDHPDGVASMAVALRGISGQRQLEAAVAELGEHIRERAAEQLDTEARLAEAEARRRQLAETVDALEARLREREARSNEEGQLHQLRAELQARDEALAAADVARRAAETNCARALADVQQLEMALKEFGNRQQRSNTEAAAVRALEAARAAVRSEIEEARGDRLRLKAALQEAQKALGTQEQRERDAREQRDALQCRLEQALAVCREREAALGQLQAAHESLAVAHRAATAERDRLVSALREHAAHLEELANGIPRTGSGPGAVEGSTAVHVSRERQPA